MTFVSLLLYSRSRATYQLACRQASSLVGMRRTCSPDGCSRRQTRKRRRAEAKPSTCLSASMLTPMPGHTPAGVDPGSRLGTTATLKPYQRRACTSTTPSSHQTSLVQSPMLIRREPAAATNRTQLTSQPSTAHRRSFPVWDRGYNPARLCRL